MTAWSGWSGCSDPGQAGGLELSVSERTLRVPCIYSFKHHFIIQVVVSASKHVFSMVLVVGAKREEILWEELRVDAGSRSQEKEFFFQEDGLFNKCHLSHAVSFLDKTLPGRPMDRNIASVASSMDPAMMGSRVSWRFLRHMDSVTMYTHTNTCMFHAICKRSE